MGATSRSQMLYWFALFVGATYFVATRTGFQNADMTAWKGAGVGLLALWAARHAQTREGWAITAVLGFGAAGDVLLETHGLVVGAVAFLVGHLIAIWLYLRHRRGGVGVVVGGAFMVAAVGYTLSGDPGVAVYALALGAMAGAAWTSDLPRRVALGAALFVLSDLLIFARMGPLADSPLPDWLIWPTYFAGQALIAHGVISAQERTGTPDDDLHHRL